MFETATVCQPMILGPDVSEIRPAPPEKDFWTINSRNLRVPAIRFSWVFLRCVQIEGLVFLFGHGNLRSAFLFSLLFRVVFFQVEINQGCEKSHKAGEWRSAKSGGKDEATKTPTTETCHVECHVKGMQVVWMESTLPQTNSWPLKMGWLNNAVPVSFGLFWGACILVLGVTSWVWKIFTSDSTSTYEPKILPSSSSKFFIFFLVLVANSPEKELDSLLRFIG